MRYALFLFALVFCCNSAFSSNLLYSYSYNFSSGVSSTDSKVLLSSDVVDSLRGKKLYLQFFYGGDTPSANAMLRIFYNPLVSCNSTAKGTWSSSVDSSNPYYILDKTAAYSLYLWGGGNWGVIYVWDGVPPDPSSFGTPYLPAGTDLNPFPLPVVPNPPGGGGSGEVPDNPDNPTDPDNPNDSEVPSGPFDVKVINTPTVNIGNTPTVNIGNIPNVFLTNELLKVSVENENLVDYQKIPGSSLNNPSHVNLSVPAAPTARDYNPNVFFENYVGFLNNPVVNKPQQTPGLSYSYPTIEFRYNGLEFDLKIGDVQKDIAPQFNIIKSFVKTLITLIIAVFFFINVLKIFKK